MNSIEDKDIVEMFLARNENAIAESRKKYGAKLQRISYNITADRSAAEEVENDTYFTAWNISLNICRSRSRLKRNAHIVELSEEMEQCIPSDENIADKLDGDILAEKISGFLMTKSEEKRGIFMRRYWFLDSMESISKRFGLKESNVKTVLFRLRNELKEYLEREGYNL